LGSHPPPHCQLYSDTAMRERYKELPQAASRRGEAPRDEDSCATENAPHAEEAAPGSARRAARGQAPRPSRSTRERVMNRLLIRHARLLDRVSGCDGKGEFRGLVLCR
jgi:hypothetical protein